MGSSWTIALGLVLVFATIAYRVLAKPLTRVPYATSYIPFVGVAMDFGKDPVGFLRRQRKKHGDVFCVDLIITRITFMLGAEHTSYLVKSGEHDLSLYALTADRLGPFFTKVMNSEEWWPTGIKLLKNNFNSKAMLDWSDEVASTTIRNTLISWSTLADIDLFQSMSSLVLSIFVTLMLGEEFSLLHGAEVTDLVQRYTKAVQYPLLPLLPRWASPAGRDLDYIEERIKVIIDGETLRRRELDRKRPGSGFDGKDYFSTILRTVGITDKQHDHAYPFVVMSILFASFLSMAPTMSWMVVHAVSTPEVNSRLRADVLAKENNTDDAIPVSYLTACMQESLRLYTNLMLLRKALASAFSPVQGISLPCYEIVAASPAIVSRDEALFGNDASSFLPERFINDPVTMAKQLRSHEMTPFGGGSHACKGETIAWKIVTDVFWPLVVKEGYEFEAVEGITVWPQVDGDNVQILEGGRRDVDGGATGVTADWVTDNLGTPFAKNVFVKVVRSQESIAKDIDDFLNV